MLPSHQQAQPGVLETSLSLDTWPDSVLLPDVEDPKGDSEAVHESPIESASSPETWPLAEPVVLNQYGGDKLDKGYPEDVVIHRLSNADRVSIRDIATERVEVIAEKMKRLPDVVIEELKSELRTVLEGRGGLQERDEFIAVQGMMRRRSDLTPNTLARAHRAQLEILVGMNTGIQAFMHPKISLSHTALIEVFFHKRCRNIACQNRLPAEDCMCEICTNRKGFCNLCMCVVCNRFDFEVNTCRWIGCDICSHWAHTDCALMSRRISLCPSLRNGTVSAEMFFHCRACGRTSELLGWVRDVFQYCAQQWDRKTFLKEFDYVCRIFQGSQDTMGRKLYAKFQELMEKLKNNVPESTVARSVQIFLGELEVEYQKSKENGFVQHAAAPQESCNRIAEVVNEAIKKMEAVAEEKMRMFKKARVALTACDHELEEKAKEMAELKLERQRKKLQIEELERIVRLKQAEADMFQVKANEAKREAERLQRILFFKTDTSEEEYATSYLRLRLSEAEAEKHYLLERIKQQEGHRARYTGNGGGSSSGGIERGDSSFRLPYSRFHNTGNCYSPAEGGRNYD